MCGKKKKREKGSQQIIADVTEQRFIRELLTQERCFLFDDTVKKRKINCIKIHHVIQLMSSFPWLLATHVFLYMCCKHTYIQSSPSHCFIENLNMRTAQKRKINRHPLMRIQHHNNELSSETEYERIKNSMDIPKHMNKRTVSVNVV